MQGLKPLQTKALLGGLLVLATAVTLCSTHCYNLAPVKGEDDSPSKCKDFDGTTYLLHSTWMSGDCVNCTCKESGSLCCLVIDMPVYYDKLNCRTILHMNNCTYSVIQRRAPWNPCPVYDRLLDVLKDPNYQGRTPSPSGQ